MPLTRTPLRSVSPSPRVPRGEGLSITSTVLRRLRMTVIKSLLMWNDRLRFAERVEKDWKALNDEQRAVATKALETIDEDPIIGAPLFEPLRGYWSYRSEGIRIVYRIVAEARFIVVLNIGLVMAR